MELSLTDNDRVKWLKELPGKKKLYLLASEIQRERGHMHACITVAIDDGLAAFSDIKLNEDGERVRLCNSAFKSIVNQMLNPPYPVQELKHDLDLFCIELPLFWEDKRHQFDTYYPGESVPDLSFALVPYLLHEGITTLYAPKGSGKSYIAKAIGIAIGMGENDLWDIPERRTVVFVNLERSKQTVKRRYLKLLEAMGVNEMPLMEFFHAQGSPLTALTPKLKGWRRKYPDGVLILDSLSRAGMGPLSEDLTGNKTIDLLRSIGGTWLVLAHTSRDDPTHPFGSIMVDNGSDILLKVSAEEQENTLGISFDVTAANDIAKPPKEIYALEFASQPRGQGFIKVLRKARRHEFLELETEGMMPREKIKDYLEKEGPATATAIAGALKINRGNLYRYLKPPDFTITKGPGNQVYYELCFPEK